jgi:uncharacterized protein (TIGR03435 family)
MTDSQRCVWFWKAVVLASVSGVPPICAAQAPDTTAPFFDAVTIKPGTATFHRHIGFVGRRFEMNDMLLRQLIGFAYGPPEGAFVQGGPDWVNSAMYDIVATVNQAVTGELNQQTGRPAIQELLRDRFHLVVHPERREMAGFALIPAKGGPRLKLAAAQSSGPAGDGGISILPRSHVLKGTSATMDMLARALVGDTGGMLILDQTGLVGRYDFTLHWTPAKGVGPTNRADPWQAPPRLPAASFDAQCREGQLPGGCYLESAVPPLKAALDGELGLTLSPTVQLVDAIVIDHIEKPSMK